MYKCIKDYRYTIGDDRNITFIAGKEYSKKEVENSIPFPNIKEYFNTSQVSPKLNSLDDEKEFNLNSDKNTKSVFNTLVGQIMETHEKKNHDYGDSFNKSMDEFGMMAAAIRLSDKLNRFKTLINTENQVKDESIEDTLLDMASYAIMTVEYIKNSKHE